MINALRKMPNYFLSESQLSDVNAALLYKPKTNNPLHSSLKASSSPSRQIKGAAKPQFPNSLPLSNPIPSILNLILLERIIPLLPQEHLLTHKDKPIPEEASPLHLLHQVTTTDRLAEDLVEVDNTILLWLESGHDPSWILVEYGRENGVPLLAGEVEEESIPTEFIDSLDDCLDGWTDEVVSIKVATLDRVSDPSVLFHVLWRVERNVGGDDCANGCRSQVTRAGNVEEGFDFDQSRFVFLVDDAVAEVVCGFCRPHGSAGAW